jgi:hypothetical protein
MGLVVGLVRGADSLEVSRIAKSRSGIRAGIWGQPGLRPFGDLNTKSDSTPTLPKNFSGRFA